MSLLRVYNNTYLYIVFDTVTSWEWNVDHIRYFILSSSTSVTDARLTEYTSWIFECTSELAIFVVIELHVVNGDCWRTWFQYYCIQHHCGRSYGSDNYLLFAWGTWSSTSHVNLCEQSRHFIRSSNVWRCLSVSQYVLRAHRSWWIPDTYTPHDDILLFHHLLYLVSKYTLFQ